MYGSPRQLWLVDEDLDPYALTNGQWHGHLVQDQPRVSDQQDKVRFCHAIMPAAFLRCIQLFAIPS